MSSFLADQVFSLQKGSPQNLVSGTKTFHSRKSTKPCFWEQNFPKQKGSPQNFVSGSKTFHIRKEVHKTLFLGPKPFTAERKSTKLCFWDQNLSQQKGSPQNLVSGSKTSQHEGILQNLTVGIVYLTVQVTGTRMSASVAKCICKNISSFFSVHLRLHLTLLLEKS